MIEIIKEKAIFEVSPFKEMKLSSTAATVMYSVRVIVNDEIYQSQVIYQG